MLAQQLVAVEVEVADHGDGDAGLRQALDDPRTAAAAASVFTVTRTSSDPGDGQRPHLQNRGFDVRRVGIRHGLHGHRLAAAHGDVANADGDGWASNRLWHHSGPWRECAAL